MTVTSFSLASTDLSSNQASDQTSDDVFEIAGRKFRSRLMTGSGKYANFDLMRQAIAASGCEIVTVAVRRVQTNASGHEGLGEAIDWSKYWLLPNTAGCQTADEAVRVADWDGRWQKFWGKKIIILSNSK